jgi:hypothetical protein
MEPWTWTLCTITLEDMAGMDMEVDMGEEGMDGMDEKKKNMT